MDTKTTSILRPLSCFFAGTVLLLGVLYMPYNYYVFLRFSVIFACLLHAYLFFTSKDKKKLDAVVFVFDIFAFIIFNPFLPMTMDKYTWAWLDLIFGLTFILFGIASAFLLCKELLAIRREKKKRYNATNQDLVEQNIPEQDKSQFVSDEEIQTCHKCSCPNEKNASSCGNCGAALYEKQETNVVQKPARSADIVVTEVLPDNNADKEREKKLVPSIKPKEKPLSREQERDLLYNEFLKHKREYYTEEFANYCVRINKAALFYSVFWFFYRKMLGWGMVFFALLAISYFISLLFPIPGLLIGLVIHMIAGAKGNDLYLRSVDSKIEKLRQTGSKDIITLVREESDVSSLLPIFFGVVYIFTLSIIRECVIVFIL